MIPKVVASEIGEAQTRGRNTTGVEDYNKLLKVIVELFWKSKPKGVKENLKPCVYKLWNIFK